MGSLKVKEREKRTVGEMLIMEKMGLDFGGTFRETCTAGFEGGGRQPQAKGYR